MDLKNGMVIKCNSEEEAQEFIKEAYKQGFKWFNNVYDNGKTCWYTGFSEIYYYLEFNQITWSTRDFENESIEYSTLKEKIKTMTKSDLKNGMVVELRNGKRFLIVNDFGIGKDSCITLNGFMGYDENLNDVSGFSEFDIIKIYKTVGNTFKTLFDDERLSLIWEREETKLSKEDKQKIKVALKKVKEICSSYNNECKKDCEFNVDGVCIFADDPSDFELDNLFKD